MDAGEYEDRYRNIVAAIWRDLSPYVEQIENTESIPREALWPHLQEMGAFGLLIPAEFGGLGLTITQYLPIIAEFAKLHGGIRALVHVHNSMGHAFADLASDEQRSALLSGIAEGSKSVAFALTEPDSGTGLDTGTVARHTDGCYVLDGRKWLITNSDFASHFMVFAQTGSPPEKALSVILVERDAPGLSIEPLPETMGCKGGQHGLLTLDSVRVDESALLGLEGTGADGMERALETSRVLVAAASLGTAAYALELSVEYAKKRITFGKPIGTRQAIQRYLAEMAMDVHALRLLLNDAATKWDAGKRISQEASICKLFGLEAVGRVTDRALLIHGGIGYTRGHEIERLYRDARLNWLEEGTPTIQQLVIARGLLGGS